MKTSVAAAMPETTPAPPAVPEELKAFTPVELATLLGINVKTLYDRAGKGKIPGVIRTGREVRFARPVIVRWLSGEDEAPAPVKARGGRR